MSRMRLPKIGQLETARLHPLRN